MKNYKLIFSNLLLFVLLVISVGIVGCGSSGSISQNNSPNKSNSTKINKEKNTSQSSSESNIKSTIQDLELLDFNYTLSSSGYIQYAFEVKNPNKDYSPQFISIDVTGKNPDGSISFSDQWLFAPTPAESTTYWTNQAGNGNINESVAISAKLSVKKEDWVKSNPIQEIYKIENVSVQENDIGLTSITGEITLLSDNEVEGHSTTSPMLVAIYRDENGKIITGSETFYQSDLSKDEPSAFEISDFNGIPEGTSTVEVYANPWF